MSNKTPTLLSGGASAKRGSPRIQAMKAAKKEEMKARQQQQQQDLLLVDPFQKSIDSKDVVRGSTGLVYSDEMLLHENLWEPGHPEGPERLRRVHSRCQELGLVDRCVAVPSREATDEEILLVHSKEHLQRLKNMGTMSADELRLECESRYDSVYANGHSLTASRVAAAAAIDLTSAVVQGKLQNGLAMVRPPGHHAGRDECCGFCFLNSVAMAARHALSNLNLQRVLIVDIDVHHGQATQREFYDDPRVLYVSVHRHQNGQYWPHLRESDFDMVGGGEGSGFNVNVPLNEAGMGDADYLAVLHQLVLPVAYEFSPELVLISAGFDTAIGCPKGEMSVSPMAYGHIVSSLMSLAGGKIVAVLEGGYCLDTLAEGVAMSLRSLLGDPCASLGPLPAPCDSVADSILNCLCALRPHWQSLRLQDEYSLEEKDRNRQDCHSPSLVYTGIISKEEEENKETAIERKMDLDEKVAAMIRHCRRYTESSAARGDVKKVALVYDEAMARHTDLSGPDHPESPRRIKSIFSKLEEFGLTVRQEVARINSRRATQEEICLCHDQRFFEEMSRLPEFPQDELNSKAGSYDSIYLHPDTFDCALLSCGSLLAAVDSVLGSESPQAEKAVAVIRPPGHHAETDEACGFCIFNNVAVAAKYALDMHGLKRVLIIDWDVHHGNGIQNMFYQDDRVLYISLHRFDYGSFFPGKPEAGHRFVGENRGEGFNVNVPWNGSGIGDSEYLCAFFSVVLPVAYQFDPELVLVSAGFDAARGDPLGRCKLSPELYGHLICHLSNLAGGRLIVALEGGYNLTSISLSMAMCFKALLGDPLPPVNTVSVKDGFLATVRDVVHAQSKHWSSLRFGLRLPDSLDKALRVNVKTEEKEDDDNNTPYTPMQYYGSYTSGSAVSTDSRSSIKGERDHCVESRDEGARRASEDLVHSLAGITISPANSYTACSEYMPGEYGNPSIGSPCVFTYSNSSSASQYMMTQGSYDSKHVDEEEDREEKKD